MDQAMLFHGAPVQMRQRQIQRIMREGAETFNHDVTARHYMDLYEKMLQRPLVAASPH